MDLVDIDKVLDNLEMNEEAASQRQRAEERLSKEQYINGVVVLSSTKHTKNKNFNNISILSPTTTTTTTTAMAAAAAETTATTNTMAKTLQRLAPYIPDKIQKQEDDHHETADETDSSFQMLRTSTIISNCKKQFAQYDREVEQSEDIRKYSEPATKFHEGQEPSMEKSLYSESSESITTSSPSTFSSGPSLEGVTSIEESAIADGEVDKVAQVAEEASKIAALPVLSQTETIDNLAIGLSSVSLNAAAHLHTQTQTQSMLPSSTVSSLNKGVDNITNSEDDISISALSLLLENQENCKLKNANTVFTTTTITTSTTNVSVVLSTTTSTDVTKNLELNETTSMNYKETFPKISATNNTTNSNEETQSQTQPKSRLETQVEIKNPAPHTQLSAIQPIIFCSTMDDISDTELDSMLQEMDIDDDMEQEHQQQPQRQISQLEKSLELCQQQSVQYSKKKFVENDNKICEDNNARLGNNPSLVASTTTADYSNGDSFSQASTVEFCEIRVPVAPNSTTDNDIVGNDDDVDYYSHAATTITVTASESLGSNCSNAVNGKDGDGDVDVDGDTDGDDDGDDAEEDVGVDDSLSSVGSDCLSLGDVATYRHQQEGRQLKNLSELTCIIPEREDIESLRPQRPTTLNLPSLHSIDLYANAGQTPPGNDTETNDEPTSPQTPTPDENYLMSNATTELNDNNQTEAMARLISVRNDIAEATGYSEDPHINLGRVPPIWVPDNMANGCMQCSTKFTMIKRRHHCRACGKVLCSVCCSQKYKLEFLTEPESRICVQCYLILTQRCVNGLTGTNAENAAANDIEHFGGIKPSNIDKNTDINVDANKCGDSVMEKYREVSLTLNTGVVSPNPNNPMEYCSTIPPHKQVSSEPKTPPTVIVPVGVLKKENAGSYSSNSSNSSGQKARKRKSVMFSDGIAPGSDLASVDQWNEPKQPRRQTEKNHRNINIDNNSNNKINKPPTPAKASSHDHHSSDTRAMGLMAQLFRGTIPPVIAANTLHTIQQSALNLSSHLSRATLGKSAEAMETAAAATTTKTNSNNNIDTKNNLLVSATKMNEVLRAKRLPPSGCDESGSFIPHDEAESLPPLITEKDNGGYDFEYKDIFNNYDLVQRLQRETLKFAVQKNFHILVKIVNLKCCLNRTVINFTTQGMHHVGNDEIIILLEVKLPASKEDMANKPLIPKDIFVHLNEIYNNAEQGNPITELCLTTLQQNTFLGSRYYGGFIYIRPTYQCMQDIVVPENPYLIGILIHRSEVPWAKVFPLRLMLRLGAQYRYYPCPHVSFRQRDSVYAEIAQTIINFLADFRNYSYTLPFIRGMYIHMEDRQTTVVIPRNRLEEVVKAVNNSSDHILAFGGNFSKSADGHLVCMQNVGAEQGGDMYAYSTQAINIQGQPRKVTGASFFVLNESLKTSSGLSGKCSIVEDGLMVQILPSKMEEIRNALKNQHDCTIVCGPVDADEKQTEIVSIKWIDNDKDINIGVKSPIDEHLMDGVPSVRVHASFNYSNSNYSIRLTDIYLLKCNDWYNANSATMSMATTTDITRMTEQIARSTSIALVPFLDLLVANKNLKIGLRFTLHQDNVCYEAGSNGSKLPPIYMNALDNHLIPTLHGISSNIDDEIILELIFYILNV